MITESTGKNLRSFLESADLPAWYRQYSWKNDTWTGGFRDILALETTLTAAAKDQAITRSHILGIARWGGLPDTGRIRCYRDPLVLPLYDGDGIVATVKNDPLTAVRILRKQTAGIGPTYLSKVLRFAAPARFGAIDSRLVRVFGFGDERSADVQFLDLRTCRADGGRWFISPDNWPAGYGTWLAVLDQMTGMLNSSEIPCPHPELFVSARLREKGIWLPADVEMALFSYTSRRIYGV